MSTLPVETQVAPTVGSFTCGERCVEAEVFERATCALQVHGFFTEGLRAVGDELAQRGALVASRDARTMRRCLFEVGVVDGASGATVELSVADSGGALLDTLGFAIETPALFLGWGGPRPLVVVFRGEWVWSTLGSTWMSAPEAALRVVAWAEARGRPLEALALLDLLAQLVLFQDEGFGAWLPWPLEQRRAFHAFAAWLTVFGWV